MLKPDEVKKAEEILDQHLNTQGEPKKGDVKTTDKKSGGKEELKVNKESEKKEETQAPSSNKITIDGKEYTLEEVQRLIKEREQIAEIEKKHGNILALYAGFTKKAQELAELKRKIESGELTPAQKKAAEEKVEKLETEQAQLSEEAKRIRTEAKKYGLLLDEDQKAMLAKIEEMAKKMETLEKTLSQVVDEKSREEIEDLMLELSEAEKKYPFVVRNDLIDFMIDYAQRTGDKLSVEQAIKMKYQDEYINYQIKMRSGGGVPDTDTSTGGKPEEGVEETLSFSDQQKVFDKSLEVFEQALKKAKI